MSCHECQLVSQPTAFLQAIVWRVVQALLGPGEKKRAEACVAQFFTECNLGRWFCFPCRWGLRECFLPLVSTTRSHIGEASKLFARSVHLFFAHAAASLQAGVGQFASITEAACRGMCFHGPSWSWRCFALVSTKTAQVTQEGFYKASPPFLHPRSCFLPGRRGAKRFYDRRSGRGMCFYRPSLFAP